MEKKKILKVGKWETTNYIKLRKEAANTEQGGIAWQGWSNTGRKPQAFKSHESDFFFFF